MENDYAVGVSDDEWRHDFDEENYTFLKDRGVQFWEKNLEEKDFLKLATRWPLHVSNEIEPLLKEQFTILLKVIAG